MYMIGHFHECIQTDKRKMNRHFITYLKCNIPDFRPDFDVVKERRILQLSVGFYPNFFRDF